MRPTIPQNIQSDRDCFSFLDHCFQSEPSARATAEELLQHSFANICVSELVLAKICGIFKKYFLNFELTTANIKYQGLILSK